MLLIPKPYFFFFFYRYNIYDNGDEMMEANVQTKLVLCEFVMSNPSDATQLYPILCLRPSRLPQEEQLSP
jgi:hypothetical protein